MIPDFMASWAASASASAMLPFNSAVDLLELLDALLFYGRVARGAALARLDDARDGAVGEARGLVHQDLGRGGDLLGPSLLAAVGLGCSGGVCSGRSASCRCLSGLAVVEAEELRAS